MLKLIVFNTFCYLSLSSIILYFFKFNFILNFFNFFFIDTFSILLLFTTIFTLILCLFIVDNKYFSKNKELFFLFFFFIFFVIGLVFSNNIFSFFLFYELLLIPSYFLVLKSSPNRRSKIVSNYFLLWTQFGSFLVLLGLFNYYSISNLNYFNNNYYFLLSAQLFLFFGFGVKIPLWPFHFWLSKTHVEANTGFSIFLSGILVKAAVFGLYKFLNIFLLKNTWIFITITLISVFDASFKMCVQNDLKKLVAFSTIQEMALMSFLLLIVNKKNNQILYIFVIFHTFISGLYFWIVDCIYRRLNTRVVFNVKGLSNLSPNLSSLIIVSTYLFMGLPFTIKFSIEVFILKILFNFNFLISIFIGFLINYLSMVFFFKIFIYINFNNSGFVLCNDLNKKEFFIFIFFITSIIVLNFL